MIPSVDVKRIGNWYSVVVGDTTYNVLIQKEPNKVTCEPSSIIVFDEDFKEVDNPSVYDDMMMIFKKVDYKYDMLDVE
jgi:hypothetical protein